MTSFACSFHSVSILHYFLVLVVTKLQNRFLNLFWVGNEWVKRKKNYKKHSFFYLGVGREWLVGSGGYVVKRKILKYNTKSVTCSLACSICSVSICVTLCGFCWLLLSYKTLSFLLAREWLVGSGGYVVKRKILKITRNRLRLLLLVRFVQYQFVLLCVTLLVVAKLQGPLFLLRSWEGAVSRKWGLRDRKENLLKKNHEIGYVFRFD